MNKYPVVDQRKQARSDDMKMVDAITKTMRRSFSLPDQLGPVSLNLPFRKEKLREITNSNMKMLSRLESVKSEYSVKKLSEGYLQSQKYCLNSSFTLRKKCEKMANEINRRNGLL